MAPKKDAGASKSKTLKKTAPRSSLFEKILENKPYVKVVRDSAFDIWYDTETKTVFDPVSRVAVGVYTGEGKVRLLTVDDLEVARERGWKTTCVENLKLSSS